MGNSEHGLITLCTDAGWPAPGILRGLIAARSPARLIDVTHQLPRGDIQAGAFWLQEALPHFPPATHLAVVDPGVRTDRKVLVVQSGDHVFVAPDNGLIRPVARQLGDEPQFLALSEDDSVSTSYFGVDIFGPLTARVHERGIDDLLSDGTLVPVDDPVDLAFPTPSGDGNSWTGEVLVVDVFGNVITNIPGHYIEEQMGHTVTVNGETVPVCRAYGNVDRGNQLVTIGNHGYVELAVNDGWGNESFGLESGDPVTLRL